VLERKRLNDPAGGWLNWFEPHEIAGQTSPDWTLVSYPAK
jgi:hypothetical protein